MNISIERKDEKIYLNIVPNFSNKDKFILSPSSSQQVLRYKQFENDHYL